MDKEKVAIEISAELYQQLEDYVNKSGGDFKSVEDFVEFVLAEVLKEEETPAYSPEEEEEIKKRLRDLGYI